MSENLFIKYKIGQNAKLYIGDSCHLLEVASFNINYYDNSVDRLILAKNNKYYEYISVDKDNNIWQHVFDDNNSRKTCYGAKRLIIPLDNNNDSTD